MLRALAEPPRPASGLAACAGTVGVRDAANSRRPSIGRNFA